MIAARTLSFIAAIGMGTSILGASISSSYHQNSSVLSRPIILAIVVLKEKYLVKCCIYNRWPSHVISCI
jgi:hypothetical protein